MNTHRKAALGLLASALLLSGCDLAGDILEFGFWTAVVLIVVLVLVVWAIARAFRRRL